MQIATPDAKNARALNQLRSWLGAVKIPFEPMTGQNGVDLVVTSPEGVAIELQLHTTESPPAPKTAIVIEAGALTGRDIQAALDLFGDLTEMLGYERRMPVNRGPLPEKKAHYSDSPELVALRHNEFRRVPNPSNETLRSHQKVVTRTAWQFFRGNATFCRDNMLEIGDLESYALVWTCNYIGIHAMPNEDTSRNDRKLTAYLHQRFAEMRDTFSKKGKNVFPMLDDAFIAQYGVSFDNAMLAADYPDQQTTKKTYVVPSSAILGVDEIDASYIERNRKLDTSSASARKKSADKLLTESLQALGHDKMIEVLISTVENSRLDPAARREARNRLRDHVGSCTGCTEALLPESTEEDEELSDASLGA